MKKYFIKLVRWPLGCLIFLFCCCRQEAPYNKLVETKEDSLARLAVIKKAYGQIFLASKKIQNGDLVTRTGNDFTSESLRSLNRRSTKYSHCGIASIEHDSIFVYHALGGEWNPDQKIRRDLIEDFADPLSNRGIGVFSFNFPDSIQKKLVAVVQEFYSKEVMFDMKFDLATDNRMYCAEFVYKSLVRGSNGLLVFPLSHIKEFEFIGVDDIFLHPQCNLKQEIVYK